MTASTPCKSISDCTTPELCFSVGTCKGVHVMPGSVRNGAACEASAGSAGSNKNAPESSSAAPVEAVEVLTRAEVIKKIHATADHMAENAKALGKYPDMAVEARARELASRYVRELVAVWELEARIAGMDRARKLVAQAVQEDERDAKRLDWLEQAYSDGALHKLRWAAFMTQVAAGGYRAAIDAALAATTEPKQ